MYRITSLPNRGVFRLLIVAALCARGGSSQNFECSPNAFPVKNFARQIGIVQEDMRELSGFIRGPQRRFLDVNLQNDLNQLNAIAATPRLYNDKPVGTFLSEILGQSTIFTWHDNGGRGTATVLGDVEKDLRNQRTLVLRRSNSRVERLRQTIADAERVSGFLESALGLLTKVRGDSDEVRETYMYRAFDHLNSCLTSCAGPKGFDLVGFRSRFTEMYTGSPSRTFASNAQELGDGRTSLEDLMKILNADISPNKTESWNTTILEAKEAADLQRAANLLAEAKTASWTTIGSNNDKINQVIGILSVQYGYQADGRPNPSELIKSTIARAQRTQAAIDGFLQAHTEMVSDLNGFLDQYGKTYERGCRASKPLKTAGGLNREGG